MQKQQNKNNIEKTRVYHPTELRNTINKKHMFDFTKPKPDNLSVEISKLYDEKLARYKENQRIYNPREVRRTTTTKKHMFDFTKPKPDNLSVEDSKLYDEKLTRYKENRFGGVSSQKVGSFISSSKQNKTINTNNEKQVSQNKAEITPEATIIQKNAFDFIKPKPTNLPAQSSNLDDKKLTLRNSVISNKTNKQPVFFDFTKSKPDNLSAENSKLFNEKFAKYKERQIVSHPKILKNTTIKKYMFDFTKSKPANLSAENSKLFDEKFAKYKERQIVSHPKILKNTTIKKYMFDFTKPKPDNLSVEGSELFDEKFARYKERQKKYTTNFISHYVHDSLLPKHNIQLSDKTRTKIQEQINQNQQIESGQKTIGMQPRQHLFDFTEGSPVEVYTTILSSNLKRYQKKQFIQKFMRFTKNKLLRTSTFLKNNTINFRNKNNYYELLRNLQYEQKSELWNLYKISVYIYNNFLIKFIRPKKRFQIYQQNLLKIKKFIRNKKFDKHAFMFYWQKHFINKVHKIIQQRKRPFTYIANWYGITRMYYLLKKKLFVSKLWRWPGGYDNNKRLRHVPTLVYFNQKNKTPWARWLQRSAARKKLRKNRRLTYLYNRYSNLITNKDYALFAFNRNNKLAKFPNEDINPNISDATPDQIVFLRKYFYKNWTVTLPVKETIDPLSYLVKFQKNFSKDIFKFQRLKKKHLFHFQYKIWKFNKLKYRYEPQQKKMITNGSLLFYNNLVRDYLNNNYTIQFNKIIHNFTDQLDEFNEMLEILKNSKNSEDKDVKDLIKYKWNNNRMSKIKKFLERQNIIKNFNIFKNFFRGESIYKSVNWLWHFKKLVNHNILKKNNLWKNKIQAVVENQVNSLIKNNILFTKYMNSKRNSLSDQLGVQRFIGGFIFNWKWWLRSTSTDADHLNPPKWYLYDTQELAGIKDEDDDNTIIAKFNKIVPLKAALTLKRDIFKFAADKFIFFNLAFKKIKKINYWNLLRFKPRGQNLFNKKNLILYWWLKHQPILKSNDDINTSSSYITNKYYLNNLLTGIKIHKNTINKDYIWYAGFYKKIQNTFNNGFIDKKFSIKNTLNSRLIQHIKAPHLKNFQTEFWTQKHINYFINSHGWYICVNKNDLQLISHKIVSFYILYSLTSIQLKRVIDISSNNYFATFLKKKLIVTYFKHWLSLVLFKLKTQTQLSDQFYSRYLFNTNITTEARIKEYENFLYFKGALRPININDSINSKYYIDRNKKVIDFNNKHMIQKKLDKFGKKRLIKNFPNTHWKQIDFVKKHGWLEAIQSPYKNKSIIKPNRRILWRSTFLYSRVIKWLYLSSRQVKGLSNIDLMLKKKTWGQFMKFKFKRMKRFPKARHNKYFLYLFRSYFKRFFQHDEKVLLDLWSKFRRGFNKYWTSTHTSTMARRFVQSLLLIPQHFLVLLKLAPSIASAKTLIKAGCIVINGQTEIITWNNFIKPGDILQILPKQLNKLQNTWLSSYKWTAVKKRISNIKYLQVDWSLLLFTVVYWPKDYELIAPSFLSERWIKYMIHFFPGRIGKLSKSKKTIWHDKKRVKFTTIRKPRKRVKPQKKDLIKKLYKYYR